jgi:hypothetical protein
VGISDLTREKTLPAELNGLLAWIACIGDAQTLDGHTPLLRDAGFTVDSVKQRNDALEEMVNQVRVKLLGAEIMSGLNKLQLPGLDLRGSGDRSRDRGNPRQWPSLPWLGAWNRRSFGNSQWHLWWAGLLSFEKPMDQDADSFPRWRKATRQLRYREWLLDPA